ncbi:MAG: bifunctional UDP-N-acetylglucosamine diphosphorylase/glucosamine-1-phosphate N-acetyltransferase GlmU [Anaerolineales bacterium]|nr:bifunctional UDP-N-acetylglucosamine diphosphorylase/glucosamine-1-phosphate N-acetyltransferase GlmU [Anaerolineales bacterium]
MSVTAVLLAAGQGTRMKSDFPKVLHPICGQPMLGYALDAVEEVSTEKPVVVIGNGAEQVSELIAEQVRFVIQEPRLGTGHAVLQVESLLKGQTDHVVVTYADMPLLRSETIRELVETQTENTGPITLLTVVADDPRGFGRIVRQSDGTVKEIIEEAQASPDELQIKELNAGAYCFSSSWLWEALHRIKVSPKGEYYLTDLIGLAVADGLAVQAVVGSDPTELIGVNTRIHLSEAEAVMRERINRFHMLNGATIIDPQSTYIDKGIRIGQDTVILPNTYLRGRTEIGSRCEIGPNSLICDTKIGNNCRLLMAVTDNAVVEDHVDIGPFARLRKGAYLCKGVHMGNFGEVKDSTLRAGVKMGHFSYIGNADIGAETNIGAGTITCNYDGTKKHPTEIGENVFIGSDTMLVAPLKIGKHSRTGAGSVVTKDVPEDTLVAGVPARPIRKLKEKDGN